MKTEANLIRKRLASAEKAYADYRFRERDIMAAIKPYIENDTDYKDDEIVIDRLAGDGLAFMIGLSGVPIEIVISKVTELKKGETIKLSELELVTYL